MRVLWIIDKFLYLVFVHTVRNRGWYKLNLFFVHELIFQKFKANDIGGNIQIGNQQINTDYLSFRAQDGLVFTKIKLDASVGKPLSIDADLNLKKINISKFFYEFEEFGLFFEEEIVKLNKLYTMEDVTNAILATIDLLW